MLTEAINISLTVAGCRIRCDGGLQKSVKRITAALRALDVADGPIRRLEAARQLREAAEELEAAQVEAARKAGATWNEIGACYGLTKQGAQQRFRAARDQAKAVTSASEKKKGRPGGRQSKRHPVWVKAPIWAARAARRARASAHRAPLDVRRAGGGLAGDRTALVLGDQARLEQLEPVEDPTRSHPCRPSGSGCQ